MNIRVLNSLIILCVLLTVATGQETVVETDTYIATGRNFDVDVENGKIYLISDHYYELDLDGNQLYSNTNIDDTGQGTFDFGPAIEVGPDGVVHVINRNGGNGSGGFNLRYSKREPAGTWPVENNLVGSPLARNYVVDVVGLQGGEAIYGHTRLTTSDVAGSVYFYKLSGTSVDPWGDFGSSQFYRVDADFRMERYGNTLHVATGVPNPYGYIYYMKAAIGPSMPTNLASSASVVQEGSGRKGMPDLRIDGSGNVFISHGDYHVVDFERYSSGGSREIANREVLNNLGHWHLDLGMSALATSPTGDTLLVVGLETGGNEETASNSTIQYTYSTNGGTTWSAQFEISGIETHAGEGRSRPRVHYYGGKFYIFCNNVNSGGIAMSTIQIGDGPPPPPPVNLVDPVDLSIQLLAPGKNFDVEVTNQRIYLVSDHYYEFNLAGETYAENQSIEDSGQGDLDFGPALAVGSSDEVHLITRDGGSGSAGFNLKYSRKQPGGSWDIQETGVGTVTARNYVVDVVALDGGRALFAHGSLEEEATGLGTLQFYNLDGSSATGWGTLGSNGYYKVNSDFRMERSGNTLHLASGKPMGEGTVYYMYGSIGSSLPVSLSNSAVPLAAGNGLSGQPDLRVDDLGRVHLTYGSEQSVIYHRYSAGGASEIAEKPLFDQLGSWELDLGLSAIAASTGGNILFAVGIRSDGSKGASNSTLHYTWSRDGGQTWIYPVELAGFRTNAGEGRMRPRVRYYEGRFYIFFANVNGGISVVTVQEPAQDPSVAASPVVLPEADSVGNDEPVTITASGSDAIYYSLTDDSPDMLSTRYSEGFTISSDTTIYAIAYRSGYYPSSVLAVTKKLKGDPPPPPPPPPEFPDPTDLSIGQLAPGMNFDVEVANDRIYLVSDHYYEYNLAGTEIGRNTTVVDSAQGVFDFHPALAVGSSGEVHLVTRNTGSGSDGFSLRYSLRDAAGSWSVTNSQVGNPFPRNYVVDVVALEGGEALMAHSAQTTADVWGSVYFYTLDGATASQLGSLGRNDLYRIDADFRMERSGDQLHLATGKPDADGAVYYMKSAIGPSLPADLGTSPRALLAGSGRRGQPDLRTDGSGSVHLTYGADQSVFYHKFGSGGAGNIDDTPVFTELGSWHLDFGLSALASDDTGDTLLAVGLKTDNSKEALNSRIYYAYSLDGGASWVFPAEVEGVTTSAGEGRIRPRVKYYRGYFYLFFQNVSGGIGVQTFKLNGMEPAQASTPQFLPEKDTLAAFEAITIESAGSDAIYYTLDGSTPGRTSTRYTGPIPLQGETTVRALAYSAGSLASPVASVTKYPEVAPVLPEPVDLTIPMLSSGSNFDVAISGKKIHLVSDQYYEFDLTGSLIAQNPAVQDLGQGIFDFGPALSVGPGGTVHVLTRGAGNGENGFQLHYSRKDDTGWWGVTQNPVSEPVNRNYVVDVVAFDGGEALFAHSALSAGDVAGSVHFYTLDGTSVDSLGDLGRDDLYRVDSDFRMEQYGDHLHLATGKPDEDGAVYYMNAPVSFEMPGQLVSSAVSLVAGKGRRGQPDLRIDAEGNIHLTYGSRESVVFERFSKDGSANVNGQPLFSRLGTWHLELGLSAVASTPGGDTLLAVGLRTDGSKEASSSVLHYTFSFDGGRNWVYPYEMTGFLTNAAEGRRRPKVQFYAGRFYVFYANVSGGIAVTTVDLRNLTIQKATGPVFTPDQDSLQVTDLITLQASQSDAIFYEFDGTDPSILSRFYEGPFTIDSDRTIHARAYRSGYLPSDVVSVTRKVIVTSAGEFQREGSSLQIYPVPASSRLSLKVESPFTGRMMLRVYSGSGNVILQKELEKSTAVMEHTLEVDQWPAGIYYLELNTGTATESRKLIIR